MRDQSLRALNEFHDYMIDKGLMQRNTAGARKGAANAVLGVLSAEEQKDVLSVDLDEALVRFQNLKGKNYTPGSLQTYKSRTSSALEDFSRYLDDPMSFRPAVAKKVRIRQRQSENEHKGQSSEAGSKSVPSAPSMPNAMIVPVPIRADVVVKIQGIPFDFTANEARRVSAVVQALAVSEE